MPGNQTTVIQADGQELIALPGAEFVQDAEILRDGQDLVLQGPDGTAVVIEGYFNADPAPHLQAPGGETLTPELVNSFARHSGAAQYADAGMMSDASPVGVVHEVVGEATITRPNGATETLNVGMPVYEGDVVETSGDGAVNIEFIDESTFAVSQNARLAIDEYVFDPASGGGESDFSILRGLFVYTSGLIGRDDPDDVTLDTPMGSIGIRGTVIVGNADTGEITVMEGAIVLRDLSGNEMTLAEQFETARFDPANGEITYMGKMADDAFNASFDSVKPVAPNLFTAIDGAQDTLAPATEAPATEAPAAPAPAGETTLSPTGELKPQAAPADIEATRTTAATPPATTEPALETTTTTTTMSTDTSFDGTADSGFEQSAGTAPAPTGASTSETTGTVTTAPTTAAASPTPETATEPTGTITEAVTAPPPSVINGTTAPAPNQDHISLRTIIDNGNGPDGFFVAGTANQHLGDYIAAAGDYQDNGVIDFFVAENRPTGGEFLVYNRTGADQSGGGITAPGGVTSDLTIAGLGDMDGDGKADFIAGAPNSGTGSAGDAQIFLSSFGSVLFSGQADNSGGFSTADDGDMFGESLAGIGDLNGDGYNDLLIGAPGRDGASQDDRGSAYVIFGADDSAMSSTINIAAIGADGLALEGTANGDRYGEEVAAAGDLDNDGFADFMVSRPGQGSVDIYFGDQDSILSTKTITGIAVDASDQSISVIGMGDMDGDGTSEIGIASTDGSGALYIFSGAAIAAGGTSIPVTGAGLTITPAAGFEIIGGGAAGDFNGDGMADGVLGFQNGATLEVFVFYGGHDGALSMADLTNPENAFRMSLDLSGHNIADLNNFDLEVSGPGDLNGDGFDDIVLGMSELNNGAGGFLVVDGRDSDAVGADGNMMHIAGKTTPLNDVIANGTSQHLVGNAAANTLQANGNANVSMRGGDGSDRFILNNSNLGDIDGGNGTDTIESWGLNQSLDFSAMGSESLSGVEKFLFQSTGQTMTIGMDDIFRLAQESQETRSFGGDLRKTITFTNDSGGSVNLDIQDNGLSTQPFTLGTPDDSATVAGYDAYFIGDGYALLIDQTNIAEAIV